MWEMKVGIKSALLVEQQPIPLPFTQQGPVTHLSHDSQSPYLLSVGHTQERQATDMPAFGKPHKAGISDCICISHCVWLFFLCSKLNLFN